jgi:hypothetical protein
MNHCRIQPAKVATRIASTIKAGTTTGGTIQSRSRMIADQTSVSAPLSRSHRKSLHSSVNLQACNLLTELAPGSPRREDPGLSFSLQDAGFDFLGRQIDRFWQSVVHHAPRSLRREL